MTSIAQSIPARGGGFTRALAMFGRAAIDTYREGGMLLSAAPIIVAIAVLPEFAQHVAEIHLGMFESPERFRALGDHPTRWFFAYPKIAGFLIAILLSARFMALRSIGKTFLPKAAVIARVAFGIALTFAAALPFEWLAEQGLPAVIEVTLDIISILIQAALTLYIAGALLEDRTLSLRSAFGERFPTAFLLAALLALAFIPSQALHMVNHKLALGQSEWAIWPLMLFDSLLVGLLASLLGAAMFVACRSGLGWRGWKPST